MSRRRAGSVLPHNPIGHSLRALTRWAVAASLGAAGCSAEGSSEGSPGGQGSAGRASNTPAGMKGLPPQDIAALSAGMGGTAQSPTGMGGAAQLSAGGGGTGPLPAGMGGTGGSAGEDWRVVTCTMGGVDLFATPIMPARAVDYAAAFLSIPGGNGMAGPYPARASAVGALGMPCSGASDSGACTEALTTLSVLTARCVDDEVCAPYVVTTQGDTVERIDFEADLHDWLGSIDTPSEAVLAATFKGLTPACGTTMRTLIYVGAGTKVLEQPEGYVVRSEYQNCDEPEYRETVEIARDGSSEGIERIEIAPERCTSGRRPAGLQPMAARAGALAVGAFLAQAATLEAASVYAFQQLARELVTHAAPAELIAWAARSALEEVKHTQLMAAQAERHGVTAAAPEIIARGTRSLFALALENAVEGCIRETYGALVAHQQAALASDPQLAQVMRTIARDEASHAELSWYIAAWIEPQLTVSQRAQLKAARQRALAELYEVASRSALPADAARILGYPSPALEHATLDKLASTLG